MEIKSSPELIAALNMIALAIISSTNEDTDWVNLPLTSMFVAYAPSIIPVFRRRNGMVHLVGAVAPTNNTNNIGGTTGEIIGYLPKGFWPMNDVYVKCQGLVRANWLLQIAAADGAVIASRYTSDMSAYTTPATTSWLPFSATFIAKDDL